MRSIFISRDLDADDRLYVGLKEMDFRIFAHSLINIQPLPFSIPDTTFDWVFLASKNAANIFLKEFSGIAKIAVAGKATAKAVREFDIEPAFVGSGGDMTKVGQAFAAKVGNSMVLFPMAEGGSGRIRSQLMPEQMIELPIYKTGLSTKIKIPETDMVFLTSPSNCRAYLQSGSLKEKKVIAIGTTTRDFLSDKGVNDVLVPDEPSSISVLRLIRNL